MHVALHLREIHRPLDDAEVVIQAEALPIDWLAEGIGVVGFVEAVEDDFEFFKFFFAEFGSGPQPEGGMEFIHVAP